MTLVYPVTVCRSDGVFQLTKADGTQMPNAPPAKQLVAPPQDTDGQTTFYRPIEDSNHPRAIDWKRKLGGLMMAYLGGRAHEDRQYYLTEFPDGYRLYEYISYTVDKTGNPKKRRRDKHSAGSSDRSDAFLYGYPDPARRRFRSPADFFPHLLWLASDKTGDRNNCTCKFCSPDGDEITEDPAKAVVPDKKDSVKDTKTPVKPPPSTAKPPPAVAVAAPIPAPRPTYQPPTGSSQTNAKSKEQEFDYNPEVKYIYRPGELIWFNNGANWRLGLIEKRGLYTPHEIPRYLIQPLSNPVQHQPAQIKHQQDMRPWLAWSVPNTTVASIQNLPFDQVPWDRVLRGELDGGQPTDYVVDGSILAAKTIDASYSLFDRDESAIVQRDSVAYKGMFLGAEKIWVGEPVRLKLPGADVAVYIISTMIETPATNSVIFKGDIYKLVKMSSSYTHKSQWPAPSKDLPTKMVIDLNYRNEIAARKKEFYDWQLIDTSVFKQLEDIKGRWYEMRTLLPTLKGEPKYQADINMGITGDTGEWMNSRGDNNPFPNQRKKNRKDALGRSVPDSFRPSRGLDGPAIDNLFPDQQPAGVKPPGQAGLEDISQFMDLDGVENYYV